MIKCKLQVRQKQTETTNCIRAALNLKKKHCSLLLRAWKSVLTPRPASGCRVNREKEPTRVVER